MEPASSSTPQIIGPFLDPYYNVNPCCCCCGVSPIINGVKTVATISMVISSSYLVIGCWFAFNALLVGDDHDTFLGGSTLVNPSPATAPMVESLMNFLLICGLTCLIGGTLRFLSSLYLLKSAEKESKTPAKLWCFITFGVIIFQTSVVLAVGQKHNVIFSSLTMNLFLFIALVDFLLLLYFLWIIIVFVKREDMPGV